MNYKAILRKDWTIPFQVATVQKLNDLSVLVWYAPVKVDWRKDKVYLNGSIFYIEINSFKAAEKLTIVQE